MLLIIQYGQVVLLENRCKDQSRKKENDCVRE